MATAARTTAAASGHRALERTCRRNGMADLLIAQKFSTRDSARDQSGTPLLRAPERVQRDDHVGKQRDRVCERKTVCLLRDEAHDGSENGSTNNRHHQKRAA